MPIYYIHYSELYFYIGDVYNQKNKSRVRMCRSEKFSAYSLTIYFKIELMNFVVSRTLTKFNAFNHFFG